MNDNQMKGYFAYWDDVTYPDWGYLPKVFNEQTCLYNKTDVDWAFGWHVAFCENSSGSYDSEWEISDKGTIQKKMKSPEKAMQHLMLYCKIMKEGGTAEDWLKAIGSE